MAAPTVLKYNTNKTENEFQSMTASQGNKNFDFKRVLHKALMGFDTILLFENVKGI